MISCVKCCTGRLQTCWEKFTQHLQYDRQACTELGFSWRNPSYARFDDAVEAFLTLFESLTLDAWTDRMLL